MTAEKKDSDARLVEVAQLAFALAPGKLAELPNYLKRTVPGKLPPKVAYELVLQSYLFFGYAQAIEAARAFAALGVGVPSSRNEKLGDLNRAALVERGEALCARIYAPNFERLVENMRSVSPELADWMVVEGYGRVLSRSGPTAEEREVASIVFLVCSGHPVQLYSHVRGARNLGVERHRLAEVLKQINFTADQVVLLESTIAKVYGK